MRLFLISVVAGNVLAVVALGQTVVVNDNITFGSILGDRYDVGISKTASPNENDGTYAGFIFLQTESTLTPYTISADQGSDWYLVQHGDEFARGTIAKGEFPTLLKTRSNGYEFLTVDVGPSDFYLGVRTGSGYTPEDFRNAYGWIHIGRTSTGELTMHENAIVYGRRGIFVGSTQAIPEPATLMLVSCGTLAALLWRRQRRDR